MTDDLDPRWVDALHRHADVADADVAAWAAIRERAAGPPALPAPDRPGRTSGRGRALAAAAAVVVVAAVAGGAFAFTARDGDRHEIVRSAGEAAGGQRHEADGLVVEEAGHGPELCLGVVTASLPPGCDGIPITNWAWDQDHEGSPGGVRWGSYHVVGTFDGSRFTLTEPPSADRRPEGGEADDLDRFTAPCPAPLGGWTAPDRSRIAGTDLEAAQAAARAQPDYAGAWYDQGDQPSSADDPENLVTGVNVFAFTGDLDRHRRELAAIWGGPLCVTERPHTDAALRSAQHRIYEDAQSGGLDGAEIRSVSADPIDSVVDLEVVFAPSGLEERLGERYGVPVRVTAALRPVDP